MRQGTTEQLTHSIKNYFVFYVHMTPLDKIVIYVFLVSFWLVC